MSNRESPIVPTPGRIVLVRGMLVLPNEPSREVPGIVIQSHANNYIDVQVFNGEISGIIINSLKYDEDLEAQNLACAWRWMPYQVQKASEVKETKETEGEGSQAKELGAGAPATATTFLERVQAESEDLRAKWDKLCAFLMTKEFRDLNLAQQELLIKQQDVMGHYYRILERRLHLLTKDLTPNGRPKDWLDGDARRNGNRGGRL